MTIKNYKDIFFHGYIIIFSILLVLSSLFDIYIENYKDTMIELITLGFVLLLYYLWQKNNKKEIFALILAWISALFGYMIVFTYDFTLDTQYFLIFVPFAFLYLLQSRTLLIHLSYYYLITIFIMLWGYFYSDNRLFFDNPINLTVWVSLFAFVLSVGIFNYLTLANSFRYLENANKQKELLLQEVHHRVKNNLNMMSSMIGLQETDNNPDMLAFVNDYRQRINAIALMHELLYINEDYEKIYFETYIQKLSNYLILSCATPQTKLHLSSSSIYFSIKIMSSLGLIFQELITNTLKYANSGNTEIYIELKQEENEYIISYKDNGTNSNDILTRDSKLGINLIHLKIQELKGTIILNKEKKNLSQVTLKDGNMQNEYFYTHKYTIRFPHENI